MFLGQLLYSRTGQIFLSKLVFDGKLNVQLNDIFLEILGFFNKKTKHQKLQFWNSPYLMRAVISALHAPILLCGLNPLARLHMPPSMTTGIPWCTEVAQQEGRLLCIMEEVTQPRSLAHREEWGMKHRSSPGSQFYVELSWNKTFNFVSQIEMRTFILGILSLKHFISIKKYVILKVFSFWLTAPWKILSFHQRRFPTRSLSEPNRCHY